MCQRLTVATIGICVCVVLSAGAQKPDGPGWTQFRGPNATGIASASKAPPVDFGPSKNMLWKIALPAGHSSPVIWGDRIFLTAFDAEKKQLLVMGLDRATGRELWRKDVPYEALGPVHPLSTPATATPVVDGERIYAYFVQAGLFAYSLDGTLAWKLALPAAQVRFGSGTSPVIIGDMLVLNRDTIANPSMLAVDRRSGTIKWERPREPVVGPVAHSGYATPVVAGNEIIIHSMQNVIGYDAATGEKRWWVRVPTTGTSTPAVAGDMVYVGAWSPFGETDQLPPLPDFQTALQKYDTDKTGTINQAELTAAKIKIFERPEVPDVPGASMVVPFALVDADKNGELSADEWSQLLSVFAGLTKQEHGLLAIKTGGRGDVTATNVVWRENKSIAEVPSPLVYENRVYYVRNGGIVTCLDTANGRVVYRTRLGAPGPYFSSPIAVGGRLIVGTGEGLVVVFSPGDELKVLARNDMGEPIYATPAVSPEGMLYVRTPSALYAFGEK